MSAVASSGSRSLSVEVVPDRRAVVVVVEGELDLASSDRVDREVRALGDAGFEEIVVDLRGVEFLDSAGLRLLLSLRNDAKRGGYRLELVRGPACVQRVFELTATSALFDWRDQGAGSVSSPAG